MKKLTILLAFFAACGKPNVQPSVKSIVGKWSGSTGLFAEITFSKDTAKLINQTGYKYCASSDTVYWILSDGNPFAQYAYFISKNNDSLWLYPTLLHPDAPFIYHRVK